MKIEVSLFGAFRDLHPPARLELDLPEASRVGDLRAALSAYGHAHWPAFRPALLASSAFASERAVLREGDALPDDGRVAVLPPVSGG